MKKRVIGLMLVMAMVLSMNASAWAVLAGVTKTVADYSTFRSITTRANKTVTIKIAVGAATYESNSASSGIAYGDATKLKLVLNPTSILTGVSYSSSSGAFNASEASYTLPAAPGSLIDEITLTGTIAATSDATLTITGQLVNASGGNVSGTDNNQSCTVSFLVTEGSDSKNSSYPAASGGDTASPYSGTPVKEPYGSHPWKNTDKDPTAGNAAWDGIDPTFGTGTGSADQAKITTKTVADFTTGTAGTAEIEITGAAPKVNVYIAKKDAKDLLGVDADVPLTRENIALHKLPFRVKSPDQVGRAGTAGETSKVVIAYSGAQVSYTGFPLTVSAINGNSKMTKPATKTYKLKVVSPRATPQWVNSLGQVGDPVKNSSQPGIPDPDKPYDNKGNPKYLKNKQQVVANLSVSSAGVNATALTLSGDAPYTITAKPTTKDGVTVTIHSPDINIFGEVTSPGYVVVGGNLDKAWDSKKNVWKETKVSMKFDGEAQAKKVGFTVDVVGKVSPYFEKTVTIDGEEYLSGLKRVEAGKVPSVKFSAKGSKTITYSLVGEDDAANLDAVGLAFDSSKGQVVQKTETVNGKSVKVPTKPTLDEDEEAFESLDITVMADNGTGKTATVKAQVAITGAKPTLAKVKNGTDYSKLTLERTDLGQDAEIELRFNAGKYMATPESDECWVVASLADAKTEKGGSRGEDTAVLEDLGLALDMSRANRNEAVIVVTSADKVKAHKGAKVNLILENFGATNKASTTLIIRDPSPEIEASGDATVNVQAAKDAKATNTLTLKLNEDDANKQTAGKITWKAGKLSGTAPKGAKASLKADSNNDHVAVLTIEAAKDSTAYSGNIAITATNGDTKRSGTFTVYVDILAVPAAPTSPEVAGSAGGGRSTVKVDVNAPADDDLIKYDDEAEDEAKVVFGAPRTVADLTAGQLSFIQSKGYTVIAVLPEVTADKDGQVEIPVELDEDAPEGAKMVYLPFAKDGGAEDDEIVDFYDEAGAPIEEVPAGKTITAAPWLRAGVTYEPVIAVESK